MASSSVWQGGRGPGREGRSARRTWTARGGCGRASTLITRCCCVLCSYFSSELCACLNFRAVTAAPAAGTRGLFPVRPNREATTSASRYMHVYLHRTCASHVVTKGRKGEATAWKDKAVHHSQKAPGPTQPSLLPPSHVTFAGWCAELKGCRNNRLKNS